jgi:hypothetical protein
MMLNCSLLLLHKECPPEEDEAVVMLILTLLLEVPILLTEGEEVPLSMVI